MGQESDIKWKRQIVLMIKTCMKVCESCTVLTLFSNARQTKWLTGPLMGSTKQHYRDLKFAQIIIMLKICIASFQHKFIWHLTMIIHRIQHNQKHSYIHHTPTHSLMHVYSGSSLIVTEVSLEGWLEGRERNSVMEREIQPCLSLCVDAWYSPHPEGKHLPTSRACMCAYSSLASTPQTCSAWLDLPGVRDSHWCSSGGHWGTQAITPL